MKIDQEQSNPQNGVKEIYEKPLVEIIEMEMEGCILAGSGGDYNPGGGWGN